MIQDFWFDFPMFFTGVRYDLITDIRWFRGKNGRISMFKQALKQENPYFTSCAIAGYATLLFFFCDSCRRSSRRSIKIAKKFVLTHEHGITGLTCRYLSCQQAVWVFGTQIILINNVIVVSSGGVRIPNVLENVKREVVISTRAPLLVFDEFLPYCKLHRWIPCEALLACFQFMLFLEGACLFLWAIGALISVICLASS